MNTQTLTLALAICLPLGAQAESPEPSSTTTVMVNCRYDHWPTRDEVARYLRIHEVTVGQAETVTDTAIAAPTHAAESEARVDVWSVQQYVRKQGRYECEHGATHVQVDFQPQDRGRAVAVVTRTSR